MVIFGPHVRNLMPRMSREPARVLGHDLDYIASVSLSEHGLSPDEYRAAFGLKAADPTVAPSYSAQRSSLAKSTGLDRKASESAPSKMVAVKSRADK